MAIQFEKYVRITSGVVGNRGVRQRELILRIFTDNALISPDEVLEFTDTNNIRDFFGANSEEYKRSLFYFAWVSKQATRAKKISFARFSLDAIPVGIYGGTSQKSVDTFTSISAGNIALSIAGNDYTASGIDLTTVTTLADVATALTSAIQAAAAELATASVDYDATVRRFILTVSGVVGAVAVTTTPLATALEWTSDTGAIYITGADDRTSDENISASAELTNNFGSFIVLPELELSQIEAIAAWNDSQNVKYIYCAKTGSLTAATEKFDTLGGYSGVAVTLGLSGDYAEMIPAIILAATDYTRRNSTCNYMYQEFSTLDPAVTTTKQSDDYDAVRCNYVGVTQTAGQLIAFYQRGLLYGGSSAPVDMNVYANEIWLKDLAGTQIMSLLLSLQKVSANIKGQAQITNIITPVIEAAEYNGVISVGKTLTPTQKAFITEETGDPDAWQTVQNEGSWLSVNIQTEVTTDGRTEYYASYILIYSKDDVIRRVEGSHELI
jgi:hypothetical protein